MKGREGKFTEQGRSFDWLILQTTEQMNVVFNKTVMFLITPLSGNSVKLCYLEVHPLDSTVCSRDVAQLWSGADGVIWAAKGAGGGTANTVGFVLAVLTHFLLLTAFGSQSC